MLTMRSSAQIAGNCHRLNFRFCPVSTSRPGVGESAARRLGAWRRLLNAESRRLWLEVRWREHLARVRQMQM